MKLKDYISIYDNEVEPSTGKADHDIDSTLINKQDAEDTAGEAMG